MIKRITIFLLILVILLLTLPYFLGLLAEQHLVQKVHQLQKVSGLQLEIVDYQRGWFHSTMQVAITTPETPNQNFSLLNYEHIQLQFSSKISHGPIIVHYPSFDDPLIQIGQAFIASKLSLQPHLNSTRLQFEQHTLFNSKTLIHLNGSSHSTVVSHKFKLPTENDLLVKWMGLKITCDFSARLDSFKCLSHVDDLLVGNTATQINLSNIQWDNSYHLDKSNLWVGHSALSLPFTILTHQGKDKLIIKAIELKHSANITENVINFASTGSLEKIIFEETSYGPGDFGVDISNVEIKALQNLRQMQQEMAQQSPINASLTKDNQLKLRTLITHLLDQGFRLQLNYFKFNTPEGEISANAWLTLPNYEAQAPQPATTSLEMLLAEADAAFELSIPKKFIDEMAQRQSSSARPIPLVLNPELFKADSHHYELSLVYKQKQFYLNGQIFDPTAFFFSLPLQ